MNRQNRVIATGYNGLRAGQTLTDAEWLDRDGRLKHVIHAEMNALSLCPSGEVYTMAVTTLPCGNCAATLIECGVKVVLYGQLYHRDSSALELFKANDVVAIHVPRADTLAAVAEHLATAAKTT